MLIKTFPKSNIPVSVCNHRYGAVMTFSEQTDARFLPNAYLIERLGFKNNVRLGIFTAGVIDDMEGVGEAEKTGLVRHDVYFYTDYWVNPNTGVYEQIPDYYSATWTNAGAGVFQNAVAGQPKPSGMGITATRYPNHGQQMYDISGGDFGYDEVNGVTGLSNQSELINAVNYQSYLLRGYVGRMPSTISFRNGQQGAKLELIPYSLGVRNSEYSASIGSNMDTWYGDGLGYTTILETDRNRLSSFRNSSRYWDSIVSNPTNRKPLVDPWVTSQIEATIANNGWYRDFIHWHQLEGSNLDYFDQFLDLARNASDGNFIWTCSYGEALEYLMLRQITKQVTAIDKGDKVIVLTDIVDKYKGDFISGIPTALPLDKINIPLSVEVDLSGTSLSGKSVKSNYGKLINLGSNKFIIEIPFNNKDFFQSVELVEGVGGYYNTSVPTASINNVGSNTIVTSNIPTRCVQFKSDGTVLRSNDLKLHHSFPSSSGSSYGIISEFSMSRLITTP